MTMEWNGPGRMVLLVRDVSEARAREASLVRERDDLELRVREEHAALTEKQRMEEALKASLEEKEVLLREIHHRVKNNLQMVSSLLTLQMEKMGDPQAREMTLDSVRRVRSLALIHQHLYGTVSLERIDLAAYARSLAETLRQTVAPSALLDVAADPVEVSVERAAPVCLILHELLTNGFKYGSPPSEDPSAPPGPAQVLVEIRLRDRRVTLTVQDRGRGLPEGFQPHQSKSLGLQLCGALTRQLRGKFTARNEQGARFELEFPL
jgi:two-component sensor histidine kinase